MTEQIIPQGIYINRAGRQYFVEEVSTDKVTYVGYNDHVRRTMPTSHWEFEMRFTQRINIGYFKVSHLTSLQQ